MQRLQIDRWLARRLARFAEHIDGTPLKLSLPFRDAGWMYIELLNRFGQIAFPCTAANANFALNVSE